ncbi:UxaA family hydrolase [Salmonella enterica]|nr:UxaA family hydrolase [Salmonella enterica]
MKRGLKLDSKDNVAVVIDNIKAGEEILVGTEVIVVINDVEMPHKIALSDIKTGEPTIKYGASFGYATKDIVKGEHVHVHNVDSEKMMK